MFRTSSRFNHLLILMSVLVLSAFPAACGPAAPAATVTVTPPAVTVTPPPVTVKPPAAGMPTIHIETPMPFQLTRTGDITMTIKVTNFKLVDKDGPNVPGEGHIDWYMDVDVPIAQGVPAIPKFGVHFASANTTLTWKNVPIGTRQFAVQLVNHDHTPLGSPVVDSMILNVVPPATGPSVSAAFAATAQGDNAEPGGFYYDPIRKEALVAVDITNFRIVNTANQDNPNPSNFPGGQGHLIYFMDIDPPVVGKINTNTGGAAVGYSTSYIWKNVEPGYHTFSVQLVNNDDTSLNPPVIYKMAVYCAAIG